VQAEPAIANRLYVAVVGSRDWQDNTAIDTFLSRVLRAYPGLVVVSGGGGNVDKRAAWWARQNHIPCIEYLADWKLHGKAAGPIRNAYIVARADRVVAFWDGKSRGAGNTVGMARARGLKVVIVKPAGMETQSDG